MDTLILKIEDRDQSKELFSHSKVLQL